MPPKRSRKVKSLSERIAEAQKPFLRRALDLGYSPLCRKHEEEHYPLLPFFVCKVLPQSLVDMAGGRQAVIADLGLAYVRSVRDWFVSKRKLKLSTFVGNALRWGLLRLVKELKLIVPPAKDQIKKMIAANELRQTNLASTAAQDIRRYKLIQAIETSRVQIAFAKQATRAIRYFHGREGRTSDSSLLMDHNPTQMVINREEQIDVRRFYRRMLLRLTERRRRVLLLRMGFHAKVRRLYEIAKLMGVTASRVHMMEQEAGRAILGYALHTERDFLARMEINIH